MSGTTVFFSYRRPDDEHSGGLLTKVRDTLDRRLAMHLGAREVVFQDTNNIRTGDDWQRMLARALDQAAFLIPVITPSFFASDHCRYEVETFLDKESERERAPHIMPLVFVEFAGYSVDSDDPLIARLAKYQHVDWTRFQAYQDVDQDFSIEINRLAKAIAERMMSADRTTAADPPVSVGASSRAPPAADVTPSSDRPDVDSTPSETPASATAAASSPGSRLSSKWLIGNGLIFAVVAVALVVGAKYFFPAGEGGLARPGAVRIPGGSFSMGSSAEEQRVARELCAESAPQPDEMCKPTFFNREQPVRQVELSTFDISATEVSNAEVARWLAGVGPLSVKAVLFQGASRPVRILCKGERKLAFIDRNPGLQYEVFDDRPSTLQAAPEQQRRPATGLTWWAARAYCQSKGGDLPTEAQWERAAKGSEGRRFPWGNDKPTCRHAVFARAEGLPCAESGTELADVGDAGLDTTPDGIEHMAGNAGEWVLDHFDERYESCAEPCQDPVRTEPSPLGDNLRVVRGGTRRLLADNLRSGARTKFPAEFGDAEIGFRCVWPVPTGR